jgi:hypothetical protein
VVAAKFLVAAALTGLTFAASALADSPTVKITSADQAKAVASLLRRSDFGAGWQGGRVPTAPLTAPKCPGFDPKESDLVVTGHADARYKFPGAGVEVDQDVQVLSNAASVLKDFARSVSPRLARCLAYQLRRMTSVTGVAVAPVRFPPAGTVSAVYRALIHVRSAGRRGTFLTDYVFFGKGRVEYEFTVVAPVGAANDLPRFELGLAQILLRRARTGTA